MNFSQLLTNFPEHLMGVRDAADNTISDYLHDVNRYLDYYREKVDPTLDTFEINPNHIRGFVTFLRVAQNENSTIERRLHGLYAFWRYLYYEHGFSEPVPLRLCNVRLKKRRNPTQPLAQTNFVSFMERLQSELTKIE